MAKRAEDLVAGDTFRAVKGVPRRPTYKCHVVAVVEGMVVFRWYGRSKQWWHYEVKSPEAVQIEMNYARRLEEG